MDQCLERYIRKFELKAFMLLPPNERHALCVEKILAKMADLRSAKRDDTILLGLFIIGIILPKLMQSCPWFALPLSLLIGFISLSQYVERNDDLLKLCDKVATINQWRAEAIADIIHHKLTSIPAEWVAIGLISLDVATQYNNLMLQEKQIEGLDDTWIHFRDTILLPDLPTA